MFSKSLAIFSKIKHLALVTPISTDIINLLNTIQKKLSGNTEIISKNFSQMKNNIYHLICLFNMYLEFFRIQPQKWNSYTNHVLLIFKLYIYNSRDSNSVNIYFLKLKLYN